MVLETSDLSLSKPATEKVRMQLCGTIVQRKIKLKKLVPREMALLSTSEEIAVSPLQMFSGVEKNSCDFQTNKKTPIGELKKIWILLIPA